MGKIKEIQKCFTAFCTESFLAMADANAKPDAIVPRYCLLDFDDRIQTSL